MSTSIDVLNRVKINGIDAVAGSYKGIPFFIKSSSGSDGRRIQVNNYPSQDTPIFEDVSRDTRTINCNAFFLDDGDKNSAIEQFEKARKTWSESIGVGELIHPERQSILQAWCSSISDNNSNVNSIVEFTIKFFISEEKPKIPKKPSFKNSILSQNKSLLDAVLDSFENGFKTINQPQSVIKSAINATRDVLKVIETAKNGVRSTAGYFEKLRQLEQNIGVIIDDAQSLGTQIIELVVYEPTETVNNSVLLNDGFSMASAEPTEIATGTIETVDTIIERNNNKQLNQIQTVSSLTVISQNVLDVNIDSVQGANDLIENIINTFDGLMENTEDYEVFEKVQLLKTTVVDYLEQASKELPTVREYNLPQTTTAFNISASLYNTYARTDDIINRNNISNPFFVESGSTLEVVV